MRDSSWRPRGEAAPLAWGAAGPLPQEGTWPTGSSLPDGLPPPLEPVAAIGHQTEHPRPLLPPPPIRVRSRDGPLVLPGRVLGDAAAAPRRPRGEWAWRRGRETGEGGHSHNQAQQPRLRASGKPRSSPTHLGPKAQLHKPRQGYPAAGENPRVNVLTFPQGAEGPPQAPPLDFSNHRWTARREARSVAEKARLPAPAGGEGGVA